MKVPVRTTLPKPKVTKLTHLLPYGELSPKDFERLCLWLVERSGYLRPEHLGAAGSEQGRDVIAYRATDGGEQLWYFQCKRYKDIGAATLIKEIEKYNQLVTTDPTKKPFGVVFVTNAALSGKARDEVRGFCDQYGYHSEFWAHTELDLQVKKHQDIVTEFFNITLSPPLPQSHMASRSTSKRTKPAAWTVLIAHAKGEERFVKKLAEPLCAAGYKVWHEGTVLVGESVIGKAAEVLRLGGPLVVCGTARAVGLELTHKLVNASHDLSGVHVFVVQMEKGVAVNLITLGTKIATFWRDPDRAIKDLLAALNRYYPPDLPRKPRRASSSGEREYRELMLESCNTIDLANLPDYDMFITTKRPELCWLYVPQMVRVETGSAAEVSREYFGALERKEEHNGIAIGNCLAESKRLVILGEPGAGKTTLIGWIATFYLLCLNRSPDTQKIPGKETLPREDWLPIIVRCRDLDPDRLSQCSLKDILDQVLRRTEIPKAGAVAASFVTKLKDGKALLLIDGLDEITNLTARKDFCEQLGRISRANKKAPIIVTSRIVGYREMRYRIDGFKHLTLAGFSKEHKNEFARLWCNLSEPLERREAATAELIRDIHSTEMERLTGNPMLLTAMALVKRRFDKVRIRKVELYWDLLEALLYSRHGVSEPFDKEAAIAQLEYLAYEMCDRGVQRLLRTEVIKLLEKMQTEYPEIHAVQKRTPAELLELLERRTGILTVAGHVRRAGMPVSEYEFRHPVFREYLAARALVESRTPGRNPKLSLAQNVARLAGRTETKRIEQSGKGDVAITENWREVLRLCVASCAGTVVKDVLFAILKPMKGQNAKTTARPRAVLAALCLADEPKVTDEVAREVLRRFVREIGLDDFNHYGTSVDNAVRELASSRWAGMLQEALDRESKNRSRHRDKSHFNVDSLGLFLSIERQGKPDRVGE
jgi:NACHT domain-containing protein/restriction endonuclease